MSMIVVIGLATASYGAIIGRTRSDVKNLLAYAAMAQVGLIYVEIGLGFETLAIVHLMGHSLVRSLQFLRSPTVLHDFHQIGHEPVMRSFAKLETFIPTKLQPWVYRHALSEGNTEALLRLLVIKPMYGISKAFIAWEAFVLGNRTQKRRGS
jgi:NAD(P)H-quinone oxidoreductase subunit 5